MIHYLILILGWPFGLRFAPYNSVKPVFRWGRFQRWGTGYFWIWPLAEQTLSPIDTGARKEPFHFHTVVSLDNIPFSFCLTVLFAFAPTPQVPPREVAARLVNFSKKGSLESILKSIIEDHINERLRDLVATIRSEAVCSESTRFRIKHDLYHYLEVRLHDLALRLIGEGVLLREIVAPEKFQRAMLDAEQHGVILRSLEEYSDQPDLIDKAVEAEFLDSLEERKGDLRIGSRLDLDYLHHPRRRHRESE